MNLSDLTSLSPVSIAYRLIAILLIILSGFIIYFKGVHDGELKTVAKDAIALSKAIQENDKLKQTLETEHEQANNAIDTIMSIKPRVRIPSCPSQTKPTTGGVPSDQSTDVLSGTVASIFSAERQRTVEIVGAAEKELASCNVVKRWAKQL